MIRFGIVGGGWRSEFYIRIAEALPEEFCISGIYLRNENTRTEFGQKYDIKIFDSLDEMLSEAPDFVVSCVNKDSILDEIALLSEKGFAVLSETPAGTSKEQIARFMRKVQPEWKVQVAEQFHLMPRNKAIKEVIDSGIIGDVGYVYLSCCHDYHAVSLMRYFLDIKDETPEIAGTCVTDKLTRYNGRYGVTEPCEVKTELKIAVLKYGNKTAVYNFNKEQYFSDIRASHTVIRGTKGEIADGVCTYLDGNTPKRFEVKTDIKPRYVCLSDDEKAIAECLCKMSEYLKTGKEFYSLSDAVTDTLTALSF